MAAEFPDFRLPKLAADGWLGTRVMKLLAFTQQPGARDYLRTHLGRMITFDNSKIRRELGVEFRPAVETIRDTINDMIGSGKIKS